jgi:hypothetical protein
MPADEMIHQYPSINGRDMGQRRPEFKTGIPTDPAWSRQHHTRPTAWAPDCGGTPPTQLNSDPKSAGRRSVRSPKATYPDDSPRKLWRFSNAFANAAAVISSRLPDPLRLPSCCFVDGFKIEPVESRVVASDRDHLAHESPALAALNVDDQV